MVYPSMCFLNSCISRHTMHTHIYTLTYENLLKINWMYIICSQLFFPLSQIIYSATLCAVMQKCFSSYQLHIAFHYWVECTSSARHSGALCSFSIRLSAVCTGCTHILVASTPYIATRCPVESDGANISHVIVLVGR